MKVEEYIKTLKGKFKGTIRAESFTDGSLFVWVKDGFYLVLPCTNVKFVEVKRK